MRPAGDVRLALHRAACELVPGPDAPRPTMREIAYKACVGLDVANQTIKNMTRAGVIKPVDTRRVDYCNKPVAVYEPVVYLDGGLSADLDHQQGKGWVDLGHILGNWQR